MVVDPDVTHNWQIHFKKQNSYLVEDSHFPEIAVWHNGSTFSAKFQFKGII